MTTVGPATTAQTPDSTESQKRPSRWAAQLAAMAGDEAAERALATAQEAERQAYHTKKEASGAQQALQKSLNSPMKSSRPGTVRAFQTKPPTVTQFSPDRYLKIATGQAAINRLAAGEDHVEFPPSSLELEAIDGLCDAVKANKNLKHLDMRRAIPVNTWAEQLLDALEGNQTLVYLGLAENHLGYMHVEEPKLGALTKLKIFIDGCESLRSLNLAGNLFGASGTDLICQGVRENVSMRTLDLSGNMIATSPDDDEEAAAAGMEALKECLTKNKFLKTVLLANNELTPENIEILKETLEVTHRVTQLDLSNNKLGSPGASILGKILAKNKGIKILDLSGNSISWKGIQNCLEPLVKINTTVECLYLQKNKFGCYKTKKIQRPPTEGEEAEEPEEVDPEEMEERKRQEAAKLNKELTHTTKAMDRIADVLKNNKNLTTLDIAFNSIGPTHTATVTDALKENATLKSLNLEMNHICGCTPGEPELQGIEAVVAMLNVNTTLQTLKLKWNFIQPEGCQLLADGLIANTGLTSLDLSRNFIGDIGCEAIVNAVSKNSELLSLNLSSNGIGVHGAAAIADMLSSNTVLTALDIQDNENIETQGFQPICTSLTQNTTLQSLDLTRCGIGHCGTILGKMLSSNSALKTLEMADNPVDLSTISSVVDALKTSNKTLTILSLWGRYEETDVAAQMAIELLATNKMLTGLDLGWSKVDAETIDKIEQMLENNNKQ